MPPEAAKGSVIALEGACGPELQSAARGLLATLHGAGVEAAISAWDASGIFYDLCHGALQEPAATPRTLLLLYAADLKFRLRWQIGRALADGKCVIAAPYLETPIALGKAAGLEKRWLLEMLRFAPRPGTCYRLRDSTSVSQGWGDPARGGDGFVEYATAALVRNVLPWPPQELLGRFHAYFENPERRRRYHVWTPAAGGAALSSR